MPESRDSIQDIWGERTPFRGQGKWPERVDFRVHDEPEQWIQSACVLCSNGCGIDIGVKQGRIVGVRGRATDAVNKGRLGPKGLNGWEANHSPDRLTSPLIRKQGSLQEATWDEAMDLIVRRTRDIRERYTASAIGFYTTGQLFLEEYYTLGVIGKAGLGTPHMDGNTRLCTATSAAALKETFGSDGQPGCYFDIDETECIVHVGHNISSTDTVLWMRVLDRRRGPNPPKLIVIDPRKTATAKEADIHLAPRLGTNVALLNAILNVIIREGWIDQRFIQEPHGRLRRAQEGHCRVSSRAWCRDFVRPSRADRSSRPPDRRGKKSGLHLSSGRLPIEPGDSCRSPSQQHQSCTRHDRATGLRDLADERTADGAEYARNRR